MSNFKIGQEVICVDDRGAVRSDGEHSGLQKGVIYRVQSIRMCNCGNVTIAVGIYNDCTNQRCGRCDIEYNSFDWYFRSSRFAPLQTNSEEADMNEAITEVFERELFI